MEKLTQNKHIHFVNITLRQSFNSSNILHTVRVILIDILLSLYPSYFAKDRKTLDLEDPRVVFLELYISEVHRFFLLERQVLLLKASPGKSLSRVKRTVFWKNCPKKLPSYTMTVGLRSRVNRPSKKYSQLSLTARKSQLVYVPACCCMYLYDTQPILYQPDERLFRLALVTSPQVTSTFSALQRSLNTGSWHITPKKDPFKI